MKNNNWQPVTNSKENEISLLSCGKTRHRPWPDTVDHTKQMVVPNDIKKENFSFQDLRPVNLFQ